MITVIGENGQPEFEAAETLRDLFVASWPFIKNDPDSSVIILSGVQCHGQSPRDLDLVLLVRLAERRQFQLRFNPDPRAEQNGKTPTARVESLCVVIEVKDHDPRYVKFRGTSVEVAYGNGSVLEWKSATHQSERQKYSLKNYLDVHTGRSPWIVNLIWLRNVPSKNSPQGPSNILPSKFILNGLLNRIAETSRLTRDGNEFVLTSTPLGDEIPLQAAADFLTLKIEPTTLDRRRMDRIVGAAVENAWLDEAHPRQLVFRGRGGTGKTMLLLQLAWNLHKKKGRKVLFLTFNHALVSDLRRLMTLLGIDDDISAKRFEIRTVHSFFHRLLLGLGFIKEKDKFLERYEELKNSALHYLEEGALAPGDFKGLCQSDPETFEWDRILVDEGQDWPQNEMALLRLLYGTSQLIVADGVDQLVRQDSNCDWLFGLGRDDYQILHLEEALRMKRNLASFANALAYALGLAGWRVQPTEDASGGRVIVVEGDYFAANGLHARLVSDSARLGNEPVDMLACVPPSMVIKDGERRGLTVHSGFQSLGQEIWNGTEAGTRSGTYPLSSSQLRVVQYDSCRGLEGWTCVNFALDDFFDHKACLWTAPADQVTPSTQDAAVRSRLYAARWVMIPLTRAMDTLVIQINRSDSFLGSMLRQVARGPCNDYVEWIRPLNPIS
jgi:hypothetical protein